MANSKITIELAGASWMDVDVIKMIVREEVDKIVAGFNERNSREVKVENVSYDCPTLHKKFRMDVPLKVQLENRSIELFPENIVKKKDKSKPLKAAYIQGGMDAQEILSKAYKDGVPVEELLD